MKDQCCGWCVEDGVLRMVCMSAYWLHETSVASCHSQVSYLTSIAKGLAVACVTSQAATVDHQRRGHNEMVKQCIG